MTTDRELRANDRIAADNRRTGFPGLGPQPTQSGNSLAGKADDQSSRPGSLRGSITHRPFGARGWAKKLQMINSGWSTKAAISTASLPSTRLRMWVTQPAGDMMTSALNTPRSH
jgi:hypothetical protein